MTLVRLLRRDHVHGRRRGPQVLLHASSLAHQIDAGLALAGVPEPVRELLDQTGVTPALTVFTDPAQAKAAIGNH